MVRLAVFIGAVFVLQPQSARGAPWLSLVDDLGKKLESSIELCFHTGQERDCSKIQPTEEPIHCPATFFAVRVEGPDHGPVYVRRRELELDAEDKYRVTVPRKASLRIADLPVERLSLSLYLVNDRDFRTPYHRSRIEGSDVKRRSGNIKIPAGDFLISLAAKGRAPDLHLLTALPGTNHRLKYRHADGWSLVVRALSAGNEIPVEKARVEIAAIEQYSPSGEPRRQATTAASGVVVFSGIKATIVTASIDHHEFVAGEAHGLSATPGTFAFQELQIERGGTIRALVTVDGEPGAGVSCEALDTSIVISGSTHRRDRFYAGEANGQGICETTSLAAGWYTFQVFLEDQPAMSRPVLVVDEEETYEEFALRKTLVKGTVTRGEEPVPGMDVNLTPLRHFPGVEGRPSYMLTAGTDAEGEYEIEVWDPGLYSFTLFAGATPGAIKRVYVEGDEETVDFHLDQHGLGGTVVDEEGSPLESAGVQLIWNDQATYIDHTDSSGSFLFPVSEKGNAALTAHKVGYQSSPRTELLVVPDSPRPPIVLHLKREDVLRGRLSSAGKPVAEAQILSPAQPVIKRAWSDADGRFEIAAGTGPITRLFVSGAGCPLTHFDVRAGQEPVADDVIPLVCDPRPSTLSVLIQDHEGQPVQNVFLFVRQNGALVPEVFLASHLARLGVPQTTDRRGRLTLLGLAPGQYDLFLTGPTSGELIELGSDLGYLTSVSLEPLATAELAITVEIEP